MPRQPTSRIPLSYPCQKLILHYLPIGKRSKLDRVAPSLRKMNRMVGFRLKKVKISAVPKTNHRHRYTLRYDSLKWMYRLTRGGQAVVLMMPNGERKTVRKDGCVYHHNKALLDRSGTVIQRMELMDYNDRAPFNKFAPVKVGFLKMRIERSVYKKGFLAAFSDTEFDTIEIEDLHGDSLAFRDLRHLNVKKVRIWTETITDDSLLDLCVPQWDIYQNLATPEQFQQFCVKLRGANIGCVYSGDIYMLLTELEVFLTNLETDLKMERRFMNGRGCLSLRLPDKELNIYFDRRVHWGNSGLFRFTGRVMKKGTSYESPTHLDQTVHCVCYSITWLVCWFLRWFIHTAIYSHPFIHLRFLLIPFFLCRSVATPTTTATFFADVFFGVAFWMAWTFVVKTVLVYCNRHFRSLANRTPNGVWFSCVLVGLNLAFLPVLVAIWMLVSYVVWMLTYLASTQTFYPF